MNDFDASIANFNEFEKAVLAQAGVHSFEELHSLLTHFPSVAALGVRVAELSSLANSHLGSNYMNSFAVGASGMSPTYSLGAMAPPGSVATPSTVEIIPSPKHEIVPIGTQHIDLRRPNWEVRDQGQRGTCVAFAVAACRELLPDTPESLSPQYLFWASKRLDPQTDIDGTLILYAKEALSSSGICEESSWNYNGTPQTKVDQGPPPQHANTSASRFKHICTHYEEKRHPQIARTILHALKEAKRPVAVSVPVFYNPQNNQRNNWNTPVARSRGRILNPPPTGSVAAAGHAICLTGFHPDQREPLGGYFIFRNSWGKSWGTEGDPSNPFCPEPGYGSISATYINDHVWEWAQL